MRIEDDKTQTEFVLDDNESQLPSVSSTTSNYAALGEGSRIDRYVIVNELGEGGMARVFSGYDTKLGRIVALKILRSETNTAQIRARLVREAQAMARLANPNVVAVYDVGTFDEHVFIAMEYIEGTTLRQWLKQERSWKEALSVMKAAGRGLAAAHSAGLVHRDFKPDNVLVGRDGRVVVSDFGIVRAEDEAHLPAIDENADSIDVAAPAEPLTQQFLAEMTGDQTLSRQPPLGSQLTELGSILGTTGYISPERALEHRDDARSDQFSFCVTLYLALYGQHPYIYRSLETYIDALDGEPESPPSDTAVPDWIFDILRRGLQRDPAARFPSMDDLLLALERSPWRRRRFVMLAIGVGLLSLGIGIGYARHLHTLNEQCRAGEQIIDSTWNAGKKDTLLKAIEKTGISVAPDVAQGVARGLDNFATEWVTTYRRVSEATLIQKKQSERDMRRRLSCLHGAHEEMRALVNLLLKADATIAGNAIVAVHGLVSPAMCRTGDAARIAVELPDDPPSREKIIAARRALAEAEALSLAGKTDSALKVANRVFESTKQVGYRRIDAELLLFVGLCHSRLDRGAQAIRAWQNAYSAALASGSDALAAQIAAQIAYELPARLGKTREGATWSAMAQSTLDRIGGDELIEADIIRAEAAIAEAEGKQDLTIELFDRRLALLKRIYGPLNLAVAFGLENKGFSLDRMGRHDLAVVSCRQSIDLQKHLFGPNTSSQINGYNNLGSKCQQILRSR